MTEPMLRGAEHHDAAPLAELWAQVFAPPLAPDQWLADDERLAHTIVAVDATGVVGSIYGLPKRLRESDGAVADVHAIGSVAVAARARGRGLARRLVSATMDAARRRGADWALLFTGTPEVYRSSGFETFPMRRAASGPWHHARWPAGDGITRSTMGPGATAALHAAYEQSRTGVVLAPERSARDWTMAEVRLAGDTLYTLHDRGAVTAYAVARTRGRAGVVAELAIADTAARGARATLLEAVGADWRESGVDSCDIALPDRPDDAAALRAFAPDAVWASDVTGMTRPLARRPRLDGIRHFGAADYF